MYGLELGRSVQRTQSEALQLVRTKCMPVLLYGLEACPLRKSDCSSLNFVVNRFFMKLFNTNNIDVVNYCRMQFNFELPSVTIVSVV